MPELDVIRRADYTPSPFLVDNIELTFRLDVAISAEGKRLCETDAVLSIQPNPNVSSSDTDLVLNAEDLDLISVSINGIELPKNMFKYDASAEKLIVPAAAFPRGTAFTLATRVRCQPEDNLQLQGLFCSSGVFCTQCEAEGFRRITPCLDRPDILSRYRVRIEAPEEAVPVLLSNGNRLEAGTLAGEEGGARRHFAIFEDPHPKPSYLFALVAGRLWALEDEFVTRSGRRVGLSIYVDGGPEKVLGLLYFFFPGLPARRELR